MRESSATSCSAYDFPHEFIENVRNLMSQGPKLSFEKHFDAPFWSRNVTPTKLPLPNLQYVCCLVLTGILEWRWLLHYSVHVCMRYEKPPVDQCDAGVDRVAIRVLPV